MAADSQGTKLGTGLTIFLVGAIAGVAGTVIVPNMLRPYLPKSLIGSEELVQGVVTGKRREADRILLTMPTPGGTVLATFTNDLAEIDLMVQVGDSLAFGMDQYQPFVTNPTVSRVVTRSSPLNRTPTPGPSSDTVQADSVRADSAQSLERPISEPADTTRG